MSVLTEFDYNPWLKAPPPPPMGENRNKHLSEDDIVCTAQTKPVGEDFQSTPLQLTDDDNDKSLIDI